MVLSIENHQLSWEIINTRNVDNIALEIDHSEESIRHNEYVCGLLTNEQSYYEYKTPIIHKQVDSYLNKMNVMLQPKSVKQALKALGKCLFGNNKNAGAISNNKELLYLFRNDLRRAQMLRFLLGRIK